MSHLREEGEGDEAESRSSRASLGSLGSSTVSSNKSASVRQREGEGLKVLGGRDTVYMTWVVNIVEAALVRT